MIFPNVGVGFVFYEITLGPTPDLSELVGPLSREKTAETRMIPEKTRRACCSPGRKPIRDPFEA